jgi:hypothetical protein
LRLDELAWIDGAFQLRRKLTMPTNPSIDPNLIDRAWRLSGEQTEQAAVTRALEEFIARREFIVRREQKRLLELFGKLEWDTGFDYKMERMRR